MDEVKSLTMRCANRYTTLTLSMIQRVTMLRTKMKMRSFGNRSIKIYFYNTHRTNVWRFQNEISVNLGHFRSHNLFTRFEYSSLSGFDNKLPTQSESEKYLTSNADYNVLIFVITIFKVSVAH